MLSEYLGVDLTLMQLVAVISLIIIGFFLFAYLFLSMIKERRMRIIARTLGKKEQEQAGIVKRISYLAEFLFFLGIVCFAVGYLKEDWMLLCAGIITMFFSTVLLHRLLTRKPEDFKKGEKKVVKKEESKKEVKKESKKEVKKEKVRRESLLSRIFRRIKEKKAIKKKKKEEKKEPKEVKEDKPKPKEKIKGEVFRTELDDIYDLVMEKKTLKLKDIKSKFKIPYSKAEEYARILDEQGMLSFYFPVIGYPILKIKDLKKDVARHKLSKVMRLLIFVLIISALMVATYFILREYGYV